MDATRSEIPEYCCIGLGRLWVTRFPSVPLRTRVPCFLVFSFFKGTLNPKGTLKYTPLNPKTCSLNPTQNPNLGMEKGKRALPGNLGSEDPGPERRHMLSLVLWSA